jgi:hypothetical protein
MNLPMQLVLGLITICLFTSCSNLAKVGYVTSTHNMPMLKEQFEANVMGAISWNHLEAQASLSPIKYVGLIGNFYGGFPNAQSSSTEYGLGGYYPIADKFLIEVYALKINTHISRNHINVQQIFTISEYVDATVETLHSDYKGYSLQCDFGIYGKPKDKSDRVSKSFAMGAKFSDVRYSLFDYKRSEYQRWETSTQVGGLAEHVTLPPQNMKFLALSGTLRLGIEPVRFMFQYSHHLSLDGHPPSKDVPPYYKRSWLTIGIEFCLTRNFRQNVIPNWFGRGD